jgi:hypothetical protein
MELSGAGKQDIICSKVQFILAERVLYLLRIKGFPLAGPSFCGKKIIYYPLFL